MKPRMFVDGVCEICSENYRVREHCNIKTNTGKGLRICAECEHAVRDALTKRYYAFKVKRVGECTDELYVHIVSAIGNKVKMTEA